MSWLLSKLYEPVTHASEHACLAAWRGELLASLKGEIVEVGAGTGYNVPHYPPAVRRVVLTEPDPHMRRLLQKRTRGTRFEVIEASMEALPFPDGSVDAVVATLVLCSVAEPDRGLAEIRRVLKSDGRYAFIEHVAADEGSARLDWQRRMEPIWTRLAGNCHLARRTGESIVSSGFEFEWVRKDSIRKAMPLLGPGIRGIAVKSA